MAIKIFSGDKNLFCVWNLITFIRTTPFQPAITRLPLHLSILINKFNNRLTFLMFWDSKYCIGYI